ncbi:hypothetical protein EJ110_NYTH33948 [Nymphaea thermarum]|nr:hypothetical protein EJ110_NYTH33948 [Nymphaea thermarum]
MINAYTKNGYPNESLLLYSDMKNRNEIQPDKFILLDVVKGLHLLIFWWRMHLSICMDNGDACTVHVSAVLVSLMGHIYSCRTCLLKPLLVLGNIYLVPAVVYKNVNVEKLQRGTYFRLNQIIQKIIYFLQVRILH